MLALALAAILIWAGTIVDSLRNQNEHLWGLYRARSQQEQMVTVSENLERYYGENSTYPASLASLVATPGYEQVRSSLNTWQGYATSPAIADTVWIFTRMVFFTNDPSSGINQASYLATNVCGVGGYDTATSWCGSKKSMWFRKESREQFNEQIVTERARLNRLTQKFADAFNGPQPYLIGGTQAYPTKDQNNVPLVANSITSLAALSGYAGTAKNCTGQYQFQGVPIDCGDMYDLWGGLIGYQFISGDHIILVSETPILNATGNRLVIAADRT